MLATQAQIETFAERIEWAYRLRRPDWRGGATCSRLWSVAASLLLQARENDPNIPVDPELFVASQPLDPYSSNPWLELTGPEALERYARRVRRITRSLRREIREEIEVAERRIASGAAIAKVLTTKSRRLSPLSRYIVAMRTGQTSLASRFLPEAAAQNASCPLYREACQHLIAPEDYPGLSESFRATDGPQQSRRSRAQQAHLNY